MIRLVILVCFIAVGKVQGQRVTVPAINVQIVSSFPVGPRTFIVPEQSRIVSLSPQEVPRYNTVQRVSSANRLGPNDRNNLSPPTVAKNEQTQSFITSQESSNRMNTPEQVRTDSRRTNIEQNSSIPQSKEIYLNTGQTQPPGVNETLNTAKSNVTDIPDGSTTVPGIQNVTKENESSEKATQPSVTSVIDQKTGVEVTLDERASFDGDKCPTGYIKANGMCVKKD